jgi:hypothetical protein
LLLLFLCHRLSGDRVGGEAGLRVARRVTDVRHNRLVARV